MRQEEVLELVKRYPDFTVMELAEAYLVGDFPSKEKIYQTRGRIETALKTLKKYRIVKCNEIRTKDEYGRNRIKITWRIDDES